MKLILAALATVFLFASCNTAIGLGRDLQQAGQGISKTAEKAKPDEE